MWADSPRSAGEELQIHGRPVAGSASQTLIIKIGSSLLFKEPSSTGGSGLYGRPKKGVEKQVMEDLLETLTAMHLSRRRDVTMAR